MSKYTLYGGISVFGAMCVHMTLGTYYTWGNIAPYIISAVRYFTSEHTHTHTLDFMPRLKDGPWMVTALTTGQGLGMPIGGYVQTRIGGQIVCFLGGLIVCVGTYLAQFCLSNYYLLILTYGLLYGFGIGFAYTSPLINATTWFPKNTGLMSGLITAGFGMGALVFNQIHTLIINPNNLSPTFAPYTHTPNEVYFVDKHLIKNVSNFFTTMSIIYLIIFVCGSLLMFPPTPHTEDTHKQDYTHTPQTTTTHTGYTHLHNEEKQPLLYVNQDTLHRRLLTQNLSFSVKDTLKTPNFYTLFIMFFFNGMCITFVASFWKIIASQNYTHNLIDDRQLSLIGSVGSIANAMGRICWGIYSDRNGFVISIFLLGLFWCVSIISLSYASLTNVWLYGIVVCLNFFCLGGNFSLFPAAISRLYGKKNFGVIYGMFFYAQIFSTICFGIFSKQFFASLGAINTSYIIALCCLFTSLIGIIFHNLGINLNSSKSFRPLIYYTEYTKI